MRSRMICPRSGLNWILKRKHFRFTETTSRIDLVLEAVMGLRQGNETRATRSTVIPQAADSIE